MPPFPLSPIIVVSSTCRIHFNHNVFMPQDPPQPQCHHLPGSTSAMITLPPSIHESQQCPRTQNTQLCHHLPGSTSTMVSSTRSHHNRASPLGSRTPNSVITSQDLFQPWCPTRLFHNYDIFHDSGHPIVSSSPRIHDILLCHQLPGSVSTMVSSSTEIHHNHGIISQDP